MVTIARLAETAALIGDPARTAMLYAMMDGRAFTAGELAGAAGVMPQTASGHLAQLLEAGMLAAEKQGRHRYFRLASAEIGGILEGLMTVTAAEPHSADAFNLLGYSLRRDGQMEAAETAYGKALAIDPHHLGANEYLGELYALTGHLDKARAQLKTIAALCGNTTCEAYKDLAKAIGAKA